MDFDAGSKMHVTWYHDHLGNAENFYNFVFRYSQMYPYMKTHEKQLSSFGVKE